MLAKQIQQQYHLWLLALSFLTRIPVQLPSAVTPAMLSSATRYFALVGFFIGGLCALSYCLFSYLLPNNIAILLMMAVGLLLTGAFHEDGWADVWDGFGGGWSINDKLNIMKDSRLGTYGAAALVLMLLLKFQSLLVLASLEPIDIGMFCLLLGAGHSLSRGLASSIIYSLNYVSLDTTSKVKPVATALSFKSLMILVLSCALVFILLATWLYFYLALSFFLCSLFVLLLIILLVLLRISLMFWFKRQLGGFTGDCLGAAQQASELVIYLYVIAFFQQVF